MLSISNLSYKIGARAIIEDASLNVTDGWRVGVIGLNGAGKSTLFKLIAGELHPDHGEINITAGQRLGWVRQDMPEVDTPLIDIVLAAHTEMAQLWRDAETETDPEKIGDIFHRLEDLDAYSAPSKAATLLTGLGFKESQLTEPYSSFSGGWRMRVALAAALFVEPEVLLLDEPTNHLDLEAIMWLEAYLAVYPHTLLVISHDRELLNKCIDHVIHVDKAQLQMYTGNYDTFERERSMRLGLQQKMHEKQQAQREHMQAFIDRFKAKASKARQAQSRMKALEKMDLVDAVIASRAVRFSFPNPDSKVGAPMISVNHADIGYGDRAVLRRVHENIDPDDRIALLGANGNGKSTLIKLIAGKLGVMQGEVLRSPRLKIGYFSQHQTDELNVESTPYAEMQYLMQKKTRDVAETTVRSKLAAFGFTKDMMDSRITTLSGGEKARLLFAFMSFDAPHLLILDEPTNHLDIDAREALVQALNDYQGAVIIVSHDPSMVERVADRLWIVRDGRVSDFEGDLEDYRKYTITANREARAKEKAKDKKAKAAALTHNPHPEEPQSGVSKDNPPPRMRGGKPLHAGGASRRSFSEGGGGGGADTRSSASATEPKRINPTTHQKHLRTLEKEITKLTAEKSHLESQISNPNFYKSDPAQITQTQKNYATTCAQLEAKEAEWLEMQS